MSNICLYFVSCILKVKKWSKVGIQDKIWSEIGLNLVLGIKWPYIGQILVKTWIQSEIGHNMGDPDQTRAPKNIKILPQCRLNFDKFQNSQKEEAYISLYCINWAQMFSKVDIISVWAGLNFSCLSKVRLDKQGLARYCSESSALFRLPRRWKALLLL